jgi:hypothetical protein
MGIAPFGDVLRPWFKRASARVQTNVVRAARGDLDGRGGVSSHEKLLLMSLLLVVAGWIIMRVLQSLLAAP